MKKSLLIIGSIAVASIMSSCGGDTSAEETETSDSTEELTGEASSAELSIEESVVNWSGGVVGGGYGHTGTLKITEGSVSMTGGDLSGGSVTVDMSSMLTTDENYNEEKKPEMLIGHLSGDDFFAVEANPTASFKITSVKGKSITGDLTVRGITNEEVAEIVSADKEAGTMNVKLVFDRQKYDVAYASTMKDVVISDEITLDIDLAIAK